MGIMTFGLLLTAFGVLTGDWRAVATGLIVFLIAAAITVAAGFAAARRSRHCWLRLVAALRVTFCVRSRTAEQGTLQAV
jgi:hypothetical protein